MVRDLQSAKHSGSGPKAPQPPEPESPDVWKALNRLTTSRGMRRAKKLTELLRFLVEMTLNGNAHYLKETTIGVSVFGRPPDYDPKNDASVRSQASRLRAKLKRYYATEGYRDPLIIDIPKGQYAASFSWRPGKTGDSAPLSTSTEQRHQPPRR